jgi:L-alanine-DL-glutamate epimerase-like enolase superfamily enzyme
LPLGVLVISTDEGVEGHTFVGHPGPNVFEQIVKVAKPLLLGRNPLDIGAIWRVFQNRRRSFDPSVQGYVDVALWDIAGKVAGLPVHRLLGTCRDRLQNTSIVVGARRHAYVCRGSGGVQGAGYSGVQAAPADTASASSG